MGSVPQNGQNTPGLPGNPDLFRRNKLFHHLFQVRVGDRSSQIRAMTADEWCKEWPGPD